MIGCHYAEVRSMKDVMGRVPYIVKKGIQLRKRPVKNDQGIPESEEMRHERYGVRCSLY